MNYEAELRNDVISSMIGRIQEVGERGITSAELADISGIAPVTVRNWLHAYAKEHPELVAPPERSRTGWRWVTDPARRPKRSGKPFEEAVIDFLVVRGPEGATAEEIATALGYSRDTVAHRLPQLAKKHIELNTPGRGGSNRTYIWTPVIVKEPVSDEIDPNDLDAIQAAFGKKTADTQKNLPEFGWKEEGVTPEREQVVVEDNAKPTKNHEGYSDPTAAAAICNAEKNSVPEVPDELRGQVWAVERQYGGEDYFAVLMSSPHHVCGIVMRYDNDGHYFKPEHSFVYEEGGAQWVGNTSRIYTKPRKFLERYVGDLTPEQLSALTVMVAKSLHIGTAIAENQYNEIQALRAKIKDLTGEELEKALKDSRDSEASYANAVDELTAQCDMANKTIESLQKENADLKVELDEERNKLKYYESAIRKLTEENESLKATNAEAVETINTLQQTVDNLVDNDLEEKVQILQLHAQIDQATIRAYEFAMRCFGKGLN